MKTIKSIIIVIVALVFMMPITAQEKYLHIYKGGIREKSYLLSSIDSMLIDETTAGSYMDLYNQGRKHRVGNIANIDEFRIGEAADDEGFSSIDISSMEIDIFSNLEKDEMIFVEGGTFTMGATSEQGSDYYSDERPTHQVTLSDYYIGKYEVTQQMWEYVMKYSGTCADGSTMSAYASDVWLGTNPSSSYGVGNYYPAYYVSWEDIVNIFIPRLNKITGKTFRLPTEAEWEYAARGGNKSQGYKYSGSNTIGDVAWYSSNSSKTHQVGTKAPNELGIYDMTGNAEEWCSDWYSSSYYSSSPSTNPTGPSSGSYRVIRGGSWYYGTNSCRVSYRGAEASISYRDYDLGLRLACSVDGNVSGGTDIPQEENVDIIKSLEKDEMVQVKGGTFTMGATSEQGSDYDSDELPTHQVTVSDFYIGKYEVTQQMWEYVMKYSGTCADGSTMSAYASDVWLGTNPSSSYGVGNYYPAYYVSWEDIVNIFIPRLNKITGKTFRLPTEAEWEYAARGGNKSQGYKYSGSNTIGDVAWYSSNSSTTHEVGSKAPNELGLYDMSGNVWEWCSDWYGSYSSSSQANPTGPSSGSRRVLRGGGWSSSSAQICRVSSRGSNYPDLRGNGGGNGGGFRLVYSVEDNIDIIKSLEKDEMVQVKGGTFTMGATSEQGSDYDSDERPTHQVTLSDYYIGKYEVTQQMWEYVMKYSGTCADGSTMSAYASDVWLGTNPSSSYGIGVYYPAYFVSWEDIVNIFIPRLNKITGKTFRLPTEAEWEYAARGGNMSQGYKYSGSNTIGDVAWYTSNSSTTHEVGSKAPNELGLYDMSGNVWEWCSDWYGSYSSSSQANPTGPSSGSGRVARGGGWTSSAQNCRVSSRIYSSDMSARYTDVGFRLVYSVEDNIDIIKSLEKDEMVQVKGGTFTMGATSEQGSDYDSDELPTHQVTVSDFYIGKYEVTQQMWEYVMKYSGTCADGSTMSAYASDVWLGTNPSSSYGVGNYYPAYYVSWEDIVNIFIPRLNKITGKTFRLPTEAEWEYAARGGNKSRGYKYSGSNTVGDIAWYTSNSSSKAHEVGTKAPNELGLYDMSGNVDEWCSDWYGSYSSSAQTNPTGPSSGSYRVLRGGGWGYSSERFCRVSNRVNVSPDSRYKDSGFRLVCTSL